MPIRYKAEYFEFPKNPELPVFKEVPDGFEERPYFLGPKTAWTKIARHSDGSVMRPQPKLRILTFCHHCAGWVEGEAHENMVNDLDGSRLCGRKGTEFWCPRCGKEICFCGMMS